MTKSYEQDVKEAGRLLLNLLYPTDEELYSAARELGMHRETARQAKYYGKGSFPTMGALIMTGLGTRPDQFKQELPKLRKLLGNPEKLATLETLFEEARSRFGDNNVMAWLRLLIARDEIEKDLGVKR